MSRRGGGYQASLQHFSCLLQGALLVLVLPGPDRFTQLTVRVLCRAVAAVAVAAAGGKAAAKVRHADPLSVQRT